MNGTPRSLRPHIGIFGRRNVGKSSLINALTNQEVAIVSSEPGTTTDPVFKSMELLPFGPVVFIDTAGLDDQGFLGELRKKKSLEILRRCDVAILVWDNLGGDFFFEKELIALLKENKIYTIGVQNKTNGKTLQNSELDQFQIPLFETDAQTGKGIDILKNSLVEILKRQYEEKPLIKDLIQPRDVVLLVVPIDIGAPKGRLIIPQIQTIREILDTGASAIITKESELAEILNKQKYPPGLVVTDSQVFHNVAAVLPPDQPLTSFSILFARNKGDLTTLVEGVRVIDSLKSTDKVLIAEACTHHPQADDIGRLKIPRWLRQRVGFDIKVDITAGNDFPENINEYRLIIHCGGCMINHKEMLHRLHSARESGVAITNYGVFIAYVQGLIPRVLEVFSEFNSLFTSRVG